MKSPSPALDELLNNSRYSELMWNNYAAAFAEQDGQLTEIASPFRNENEFLKVIEALRELATDHAASAFDGILPGGARFHVTLPPLSPAGATLTIRKFSTSLLSLDSLVESGGLTEKSAVFLKAAVRARVNILISGGTGAGKTTLLNALASHVGPQERIITVEDVPEIKLRHKNWIRLVAKRDKSNEAVRECLVGCLRMRPDRIVVGECRSAETLEMLQMMNTGHDGSMSTLHANSSHDALTRLESLILFHAGVEIPMRALRRQIADGVDLIVHVGRGQNGKRFVEEVLEITGTEGDVISRLPLFKMGPANKLIATGQVPTFVERFEKHGVPLPKNFFHSDSFEAPNILKISRVAV